MKKCFLMTIIALSTIGATAQKQVSSAELINRIRQGESLLYENVTFTGDIDLSGIDAGKLTGQYPENGKTTSVFTNFVKQPVSFKHCTFKGKITMCKKTENTKEKKETRIEFTEDVTFQNCVFEESADFELTNFNKVVSFENTVFKEQPRFVRMGLYQKPNIQGLKLQKGCLFQFDQTKKEKIITEQELSKVIDAM